MSDVPEYDKSLPVTESRTGFSVHVTLDIRGMGSKEEAREAAMAKLKDLPDKMKVSQIHIGRYVITALSGKYKDTL